MKIKSMKLKNFRSYKNETQIEFCDLTAFVGKNDIGKSSVLEALEIFFNDNKGIVKLDKDDINKQSVANGDTEISIAICFEDLPEHIILDATNETTLESEYLLNTEAQLEVVKKYPNANSAKVFIKAYHPTNDGCKDLLLKKDSELRTIIEQGNIPCEDKTRNAIMRSAIWSHYGDNLALSVVEIDITKGETKSIWDKLQTYLPLFSLFQSDRKNSDSDNEVQDPLKEAVKQILSDEAIREQLNSIASEVERKLTDVSSRTLEKIREMSPDIANSLTPVVPASNSLKWADVFKSVSISSDESIPINKRGSGVKRLVLLNFFRAEAERRLEERNTPTIIYAIEEPETSQHTENQKVLINAFLDLASQPNTQIIITTHSANIVKQLDFDNLCIIADDGTTKTISNVSPNRLPYPSLNEVNYLAFSEISEEYHNELYGFIEGEGEIANYKNGKPTVSYIKLLRDGTTREEHIVQTEYIRHQIHHPENTHNPRYTDDQLKESIDLLRAFAQTLIT